MFPILYKHDDLNLAHNGLGALVDCLQAKAYEELNGQLTLELLYPMSGVRYEDLEIGSFILSKYNSKDESHIFRISTIEQDAIEKTVHIHAESKTYELADCLITDVIVNGKNAQALMDEVKKSVTPKTDRKSVV